VSAGLAQQDEQWDGMDDQAVEQDGGHQWNGGQQWESGQQWDGGQQDDGREQWVGRDPRFHDDRGRRFHHQRQRREGSAMPVPQSGGTRPYWGTQQPYWGTMQPYWGPSGAPSSQQPLHGNTPLNRRGR
jgi:hypothetical protein